MYIHGSVGRINEHTTDYFKLGILSNADGSFDTSLFRVT